MITTAGQIVSGSLKLLGVLAAGETLSAVDGADGLARLNSMIDLWGLSRLTKYFLLRTVKTLAASTASYTIGTGGSINIERPVSIDGANLILDSSASPVVEMPIEVFTDDRWRTIRIKNLTSRLAQGIWYDHNWSAGLGTIYVYPIPTTSLTQLVLYTPVSVAQFTDLPTSYSIPPGYEMALRTNLAVVLAPEFGRQLDPSIYEMAKDSKADLMSANLRPVDLKFDEGIAARASGTWDWMRGGFGR